MYRLVTIVIAGIVGGIGFPRSPFPFILSLSVFSLFPLLCPVLYSFFFHFILYNLPLPSPAGAFPLCSSFFSYLSCCAFFFPCFPFFPFFPFLSFPIFPFWLLLIFYPDQHLPALLRLAGMHWILETVRYISLLFDFCNKRWNCLLKEILQKRI